MLLRLVTLENLFYVDLTRRDAEEGGARCASLGEDCRLLFMYDRTADICFLVNSGIQISLIPATKAWRLISSPFMLSTNRSFVGA